MDFIQENLLSLTIFFPALAALIISFGTLITLFFSGNKESKTEKDSSLSIRKNTIENSTFGDVHGGIHLGDNKKDTGECSN